MEDLKVSLGASMHQAEWSLTKLNYTSWRASANVDQQTGEAHAGGSMDDPVSVRRSKVKPC
jgi:hypothetical protein